MIPGSIYFTETNQLFIRHVSCTTNPWERMCGLLGRKKLESDEALLIKPCSSIHTFFMQYPIDLVYLDKHWQVIKIVKDLSPWRTSWCFGARMVLETTSGFTDEFNINNGSKLKWI